VKHTSSVYEEQVLHLIHVAGWDSREVDPELMKRKCTHIKSTRSPFSPFSLSSLSRVCVLRFKTRQPKFEYVNRGLPIRKIALASLELEFLVRFKQGVIQRLRSLELFVRFSVEGTVWEVQRFLSTFDRP
jgi:hypothetical protein